MASNTPVTIYVQGGGAKIVTSTPSVQIVQGPPPKK